MTAVYAVIENRYKHSADFTGLNGTEVVTQTSVCDPANRLINPIPRKGRTACAFPQPPRHIQNP